MISVAMATYNGAKYLLEQMDSILSQTVFDIEIIVCDDCSTDETWSILQSYAKNDSRIHCYRNNSNLGFKKNFEKAISLCQGELVALSDQDDIWEKNHLEVLQNLIGNYDIACGNAELIDKEGNKIGKRLNEINYFYKCPRNEKIPYRIFYSNGCFQGASMLIKRNFLKQALPIPNDIKYHDIWLSALACFKNGLVYSHAIITRHRRHETNASKNPRWTLRFGFIHYKKHGNFQKDRIFLAREILARCKNELSPAQVTFLEHIDIYVRNKNFKWGKLKNQLFRLIHYKSIYTTRTKVFFERDPKIIL